MDPYKMCYVDAPLMHGDCKRMDKQEILKENNNLIGKKVICAGYLVSSENRYEIKLRNICEKFDYDELSDYDFWIYDSISKKYLYPLNGSYSDFIKEEYSIKFEKLEGIVESIESLKIASTAALAGNYYVNDKICIEYLVATIIDNNNSKFQVPLSCIEQSSVFDNGENLFNLLSSIKKINSYVQSPNKIELLKDGRIKISHSYIDFKIQRAELKLKDAQRWLILDLKNLKVETSAASDFSLTYTQYFYISDEEFNEIINCLKECNFAFSEQFFGKNNYEKLQNTIRSPYFPKLAMLWDDESEFRKLCFKPDCIELLIKAFTIDVTEFTINLAKNNPLKFCDYAILYLCGFRDNDLIKEIIKLPKFNAGYPGLIDEYSFKYSDGKGFYFEERGSEDFTDSQSTIFRILLKLFSQEKAAEIIIKMYKSIRPYTSGFADLILSRNLPEEFISYICENGFTKELHEQLEPMAIEKCNLEVDALRKAGGFENFCSANNIFQK